MPVSEIFDPEQWKSKPTWHNVILLQPDGHASDGRTIDLLAMLIAFMHPKVIVEAGTYMGHATMAMAGVLYTLGWDSKIYTADVNDLGTRKFMMEKASVLEPFIEYHIGDYAQMLEGVPGYVDLAYIDASDKDNEHQRLDHAALTYKRLSPGGLLVVDDTEGNWADARWFRENGGVHFSDHRGLTLLQKPAWEPPGTPLI